MADQDITQILAGAPQGGMDRESADHVFAAAYQELKSMAARRMQEERDGHTLQPTALLNEAYLRLVDPTEIRWQNRSHFFAVAARAMRQVLIDHARRRDAAKRGGGWERVVLEETGANWADRPLEAMELESALQRLAEHHERMAHVVELRVFGGMTGREIAAVLGVSRKTAAADWRFASMWLRSEFAGDELS